MATSPDRSGLVGVNGPGHVADVFDVEKLDALAGRAAIGHTRYSTAGDSSPKNIQPIQIECKFGHIAVCHNGNLVNAHILRHMLVQRGSIFRTTSDTEVLVHLFAKSGQTEELEAVAEAVRQAEGAFSLLFLTEDALYAVRDPRGFRPLLLGRAGDGYVVCSETCALDLLDGEYIRDIEAGELIRIDGDGVHSLKVFDEAPVSQCIFEHVYFARPDSRVFGRDVYKTRIKLGESLAKHTGVDADVVVPVPDSGLIAAIGYAQATGIPLEMGLIRNHYVGRTFIEPRQSIRNFGVRVKLNPVHAVLKGRRVILIDDSIVRGTTSRQAGPDGAERWGHRGALPGVLTPDHRPLPLRDRYPVTLGTDRRPAECGGDPAVPERGQPRLPAARGPPGLGRGGARPLLHRVFLGQLPACGARTRPRPQPVRQGAPLRDVPPGGGVDAPVEEIADT